MHVYICFRDADGNTPLHLAASKGYTQTMKAILSFHGHLIDCQNKLGVSIIMGRSGRLRQECFIYPSWDVGQSEQQRGMINDKIVLITCTIPLIFHIVVR